MFLKAWDKQAIQSMHEMFYKYFIINVLTIITILFNLTEINVL